MTTGRLVVHSMIVLAACVVGFALGRWSPPGVGASDDRFSDSSPNHERTWERDVAGSLGGSLAVTGDTLSDDSVGPQSPADDGPPRRYFPETVVSPSSSPAVPGRFPATELAEPVGDSGRLATHDQVRSLIEKQLPSTSNADKQVWVEELQGLPFESVREILLLKKALGPLGSQGSSSDAAAESATDR
ncbi:MAG: hypothetical protein VB859_17920 [Planctomycetaceae bacterium]